MNILAIFKKRETININSYDSKNLINNLIFANNFNSKMSLNELVNDKSICIELLNKVKKNQILYNKYLNGELYDLNPNNNNIIYILYGKYIIFKSSFLDNKFNLNFSQDNYKKFINILKQVEDFKIKCEKKIKENNNLVSKLYFSACIALKDYLYLNEKGLDNNLIDLIDFNENGLIYNSSNDNNIQFIKNLNKNSFLYPLFLQFDSGFENNYMSDNNNSLISTCMISKLILQQIKLDLIKSLDNYGIRIFFDTDYYAHTSLNTNITIYNEKKIFKHKLTDLELLNINDTTYNKRVAISFLQKFERFLKLKKTINKNKENFINSPRGYFNFSKNAFITLNSGEIGELFEYFLTNGNRNLIDKIFESQNNDINFKDLFNIDILLKPTNDELIFSLKKVLNIDKNETENNIEYSKNKREQTKKENNNEEKNNEEIDPYLLLKCKMIEENPYRKFTFFKNSIIAYVYDKNGNLVPYQG